MLIKGTSPTIIWIDRLITIGCNGFISTIKPHLFRQDQFKGFSTRNVEP